MLITLASGEFFGSVVAAAEWDSFRISETRYGRGAFLPAHRHAESYLTFVLAGGYHERSNGQTRACGAQSVVLHPAGDTHEDDFSARPTRCLNVVLGSPFVARLGSAGDALMRGEVIEGSAIAAISARLAAEARRSDSAAPLIVEGLLLEMFGVISRQEREVSGARAWLVEARAIVEQHFREPLTLSDVATAVGMHPVHLARSFRRSFGSSVGERIRQLRLQWAREQLAGGAALASVAADAGFSDQSHFTKAFTRAHGVGPAEYRRRMRAGF